MSFLICEIDTFEGLLDVDDTPGDTSTRNSSCTKMKIINAVHNRWHRQGDKNYSRKSIVNRVTREGADAPPSGVLYISPELTEREISMSFVTQQMNKYSGLNLYLEFTQYAAFIQMSTVKYANVVPDFLPNHLDENNDPITWVDWHDDTHNHVEVDGTFYVPTNSFNNGQDLAGSILVMLESNSPSYNVRPMNQYPNGE